MATIAGQPGVYGTQDTPANGNLAGGRQGAASRPDSNGNFWLYGANGYHSADTYRGLHDLWMYYEPTNQWTGTNETKLRTIAFHSMAAHFSQGTVESMAHLAKLHQRIILGLATTLLGR